MNMQEILNNLAVLEKELQNIKSARVMAEETITSYKLTQKEIVKLLEGIKNADASMMEIIEGFKSQNISFSNKLQQGIGKVNAYLATIGESFKEKCDKSNTEFDGNISKAVNDLKQKTASLLEQFEAENASLKQRVNEISDLRSSLANAAVEVSAINSKLIGLQESFAGYQQKQDAVIAGISGKCSSMGSTLKEIDERLKNIDASISDDNNVRKTDYAILRKSSKCIQVCMIITIILVIISIAYPIFQEYLKV